jgi:transketolase
MRAAFVQKLVQLANRDSRIVFLTADLGFMVVEPFANAFPNRFINVGVAEQNMIGIATGLAEAGYIPFCYSIAPFAVFRPYEFIRNGPVAHQLPVRIVGVGGGFDYATAGATHHALEDIAVMRALPTMTVLAPADAEQTACALEVTWNLPGPIYYRLEKSGRPVPSLGGSFALGRAQRIRAGSDLLVLCVGSIVSEALAAADLLRIKGVETAVVVVASLQPAPVMDIRNEIARVSAVLTFEAHHPNGGLGSLVAEIMVEAGLARPFLRVAAADTKDERVGSVGWLNARHGLSSSAILAAADHVLASARS